MDAVLGTATDNQSSMAELIVSSQAVTSSFPIAHVPLIDHLDMPVSAINENMVEHLEVDIILYTIPTGNIVT